MYMAIYIANNLIQESLFYKKWFGDAYLLDSFLFLEGFMCLMFASLVCGKEGEMLEHVFFYARGLIWFGGSLDLIFFFCMLLIMLIPS